MGLTLRINCVIEGKVRVIKHGEDVGWLNSKLFSACQKSLFLSRKGVLTLVQDLVELTTIELKSWNLCIELLDRLCWNGKKLCGKPRSCLANLRICAGSICDVCLVLGYAGVLVTLALGVIDNLVEQKVHLVLKLQKLQKSLSRGRNLALECKQLWTVSLELLEPSLKCLIAREH